MKLYRQFNKRLLHIMAIVLPALMLNPIYSNSNENSKNYDKKANDLKPNVNRQLYFLYAFIHIQPEEESPPVHFIRSDTSFFQQPERFFLNDVILLNLALFNIIAATFLLLHFYLKQFNRSTELACHIGGHAPPTTFMHLWLPNSMDNIP